MIVHPGIARYRSSAACGAILHRNLFPFSPLRASAACHPERRRREGSAFPTADAKHVLSASPSRSAAARLEKRERIKKDHWPVTTCTSTDDGQRAERYTRIVAGR